MSDYILAFAGFAFAVLLSADITLGARLAVEKGLTLTVIAYQVVYWTAALGMLAVPIGIGYHLTQPYTSRFETWLLGGLAALIVLFIVGLSAIWWNQTLLISDKVLLERVVGDMQMLGLEPNDS